MSGPERLAHYGFEPDLFTEVLGGRLATRAAYYRAHPCGCGTGEFGGPDQSCPVCRGRGTYWDEPGVIERTEKLCRAGLRGEHLQRAPVRVLSVVGEDGASYPPGNLAVGADGRVTWPAAPAPAEFELYDVTYEHLDTEFRAGVVSVVTRREYQRIGEFELTDLQMTVDRYHPDKVTPNPAWQAGENDRFVLLDAWRRHASKLTRGPGSTDDLTFARVRDATLAGVRGGGVFAWVEGVDYTLAGGRVTWLPNRGPKPGEAYAVECLVCPEYYVFMDLPQLRHEDAHNLPRKLLLRSFEFFANRKAPGGP